MKNKLLFDSIDVRGKSFLDVGCFDGNTCVRALEHGADPVTGIDYVINEALVRRSAGKFYILQFDIFSEKWLHLPKFDVVSCQGVFYHVPDPISLLNRLRLVTGQILFLEGAIIDSDRPVMQFHADDKFNSNYSNWWAPSLTCLTQMLEASGFTDITFLDDKPPRAALTATPGFCDLRKIMPRHAKYMRLDGSSGSKTHNG
ncbi:MAG: DUF1698 domain-containing protein [Dehalococcoidales bacterium]